MRLVIILNHLWYLSQPEWIYAEMSTILSPPFEGGETSSIPDSRRI